MARRIKNFESIYTGDLKKLTHQHCHDLVSESEVSLVIDLFLEELKTKLLNLDAVFISNLGYFSPRLLKPLTKFRNVTNNTISSVTGRAIIRFIFEKKLVNYIKKMEKLEDAKIKSE